MKDHRRPPPPPSAAAAGEPPLNPLDRQQCPGSSVFKASDALPLPLYLTNGVFFAIFFSVAYFLLHRWREKIRTSTPLHVITLSEIAALVSLVASVVYLLGFFGVVNAEKVFDDQLTIISPDKGEEAKKMLSQEDEEIVRSVVEGSTPSYSLESKIGDCRRAAGIRRAAVERLTGQSLKGLPLDGFDYESVLGQCCEMPVGYVVVPVGVAGPLLLDGREYTVPMATTEGCLVASTNRGCKAIYVSGGATSTVLRDGMTRAPVVRFGSARRAAELKLFLEEPDNFDSLAVVFNRFPQKLIGKKMIGGHDIALYNPCLP
ncbi:hypothetical protein CRG98_012277 [Punica granatum]|uniref:Hydroxymethylglutaryl-CoA reductase (NADPH) n=1 Tax=Punica granatum TaxID=22663 RepID=A0A2I0KFQ6_PUNGR|nr:hypothetical protein CRG98_012277 [Punica granatum]